jgi:hypothetical protein
MRLSSLSNGFFRGSVLALALVFASTAIMPVDAEAAQKKRNISKKKKSPSKR